jgi:hypothetical protein
MMSFLGPALLLEGAISPTKEPGFVKVGGLSLSVENQMSKAGGFVDYDHRDLEGKWC